MNGAKTSMFRCHSSFLFFVVEPEFREIVELKRELRSGYFFSAPALNSAVQSSCLAAM